MGHCRSLEMAPFALVGTWLRGTMVERWSLTDELSVSCTQPTADGLPFTWVNRPL